MEIVTSNALVDEIRIKDGLILRVDKCDADRSSLIEIDIDKKKLGRVTGKGMTDYKQVKKDILSEDGEVVFKEGEYIKRDYWASNKWMRVTTTTDPKNIYFELKCAGGTIEGYSYNIISIMDEVKSIMKERYGI